MGQAAIYRLERRHNARRFADPTPANGRINLTALVLAVVGIIVGLIASSNLSAADVAARLRF